jgi:hypothetical protein
LVNTVTVGVMADVIVTGERARGSRGRNVI